jgi:ATP-binding cassette subfamily B multidrug efflux pump
VNVGLTRPGVILAFLTYFNLILNAIRGLNRIFVIYSKARASADRIGLVLAEREDQPVIGKNTAADEYCPVKSDNYIEFRHVSFRYDGDAAFAVKQAAGAGDSADSFAGGKRENCLSDISFSIGKGDSLGIIGPTGCGKTTILNLLMRFYDAGSGTVLIGGRDVRSYERDELRRKFGAVFQNDVVFADTVRRNIDFGRHLTDEQIDSAANDACVTAYIYDFAERYEHRIEIHGANLSGGQKQRIMIARALAAHPDILILDDSSSALDFRTDARLRSAIRKKYRGTTTIMVAQRVSSIMQMDKILVISDGQIEACGKHRDLLRNCPYYREVYESQMGAENAAAE